MNKNKYPAQIHCRIDITKVENYVEKIKTNASVWIYRYKYGMLYTARMRSTKGEMIDGCISQKRTVI